MFTRSTRDHQADVWRVLRSFGPARPVSALAWMGIVDVLVSHVGMARDSAERVVDLYGYTKES